MKIREIVETLDCKLLCGDDKLNEEVEYAFASDLMSDVLTTQAEKMVLITGLTNIQSIRTAEMSDIQCVIIVRDKKATPEMIELAQEVGLVLIDCRSSMFKTSGLLYSKGLKPLY